LSADQKNGGMIYQREIQIQTSGHRHMQDVTDEIAEVINNSRIRSATSNRVGGKSSSQ